MRAIVLGLILAAVAGCTQADNAPREHVLFPVGGTITVDGKPLATAVVTFLQVDETGTTSGGDTDENGHYQLVFGASPGAAAASYKVAVSYLIGIDGKPIGRGARSNPSPANPVHLAKELIPPENSNLGRTVLKATVPTGGGTFDFDIKGPLPTVPPAEGADKASEH